MPQTPLRTLTIFERGSTYSIFDSDDETHLFTIRFNSRSVPQMSVIRGSNTSSVVGSATYHTTKKLGVSTGSNITLKLPSSGTVSLSKDGGFFSNDKRTMRSAVLGPVYWISSSIFDYSWERRGMHLELFHPGSWFLLGV